jgi:phosphohistidine swiveling domain-containing protein
MVNILLHPKDFFKLGTWANGTYFNGLYLEAENKKNYKNTLGVVFCLEASLNINDDFFYPIMSKKRYKNFFSKDPLQFLVMWNKSCIDVMKKVREYVDFHRNERYQKLTDEELLHAIQTFEEVLSPLFIFLCTCPINQEIVEQFAVKNVYSLDFSQIRPLKKISIQRINEGLCQANNMNDLEILQEEYVWFGFNLLRGNPLSIDDLQRMKKTATLPREVEVSSDPIINTVQELIWVKYERIDVFNYALYHMRNLYYEALKRLDLDVKYWDVFLPAEFKYALLTKQLPSDLDARFEERGVVKFDGKIGHVSHHEFIEYRKLFATDLGSRNILKGRVASPGMVQGRCVVIQKPEDIKRVKEGDVLVVTTTLVEYEPYMHKSKGIIAEVGSLLSHSAIFSREFKIPCIVAVKDATKILKDGDLVEVDAEKGIVRKLTLS